MTELFFQIIKTLGVTGLIVIITYANMVNYSYAKANSLSYITDIFLTVSAWACGVFLLFQIWG